MELKDIFTPERIRSGANCQSKKRVLKMISSVVHETIPEVNAYDALEQLVQRERLGSTAIGHGVAIPHCRIQNLPRALGIFVRLDHGIDYDAEDNTPVDLIFALVVPEQTTDDHLKLLSMLAEKLEKPDFRQLLRDAEDNEALYKLIAV